MDAFSECWLHLRESVDRRSRDVVVGAALRQGFADRAFVRVVDFGCGTGSNLRATAPLLGMHQDWVLLDHDPALLNAARGALARWADKATPHGDLLHLEKDGRFIDVRFEHADLAAEGGLLRDAKVDLLTASAFFDLASHAFIARVVAAVVERRAAFHTVLTYNGAQAWSPDCAGDDAVCRAFNVHQGSDKGFGPAAGASASAALAEGFAAAGYRVTVGDSPWRLELGDAALLRQLAEGVGDAAEETGLVDPAVMAAWRARAVSGVVMGHSDLLALPG
eukprot:gene11986-12075_t